MSKSIDFSSFVYEQDKKNSDKKGNDFSGFVYEPNNVTKVIPLNNPAQDSFVPNAQTSPMDSLDTVIKDKRAQRLNLTSLLSRGKPQGNADKFNELVKQYNSLNPSQEIKQYNKLLLDKANPFHKQLPNDVVSMMLNKSFPQVQSGTISDASNTPIPLPFADFGKDVPPVASIIGGLDKLFQGSQQYYNNAETVNPKSLATHKPKSDNVGDVARGLGNIVGGGLQTAFSSIPVVFAATAIKTAAEPLATSITKKLGGGKSAQETVKKITGFLTDATVFNPSVALALAMSGRLTQTLDNSDAYRKLFKKDSDRKIATDIISNGLMLLSVGLAGKATDAVGRKVKGLYKPEVKPLTDEQISNGSELTDFGKNIKDRLEGRGFTEAEKQQAIDYLKKQDVSPNEILGSKVSVQNGKAIKGLLDSPLDTEIKPPANLKIKPKKDTPLNTKMRRGLEQTDNSLLKNELSKILGNPRTSKIDESLLKQNLIKPEYQKAGFAPLDTEIKPKKDTPVEPKISKTDKMVIEDAIKKKTNIRDIADKSNIKKGLPKESQKTRSEMEEDLSLRGVKDLGDPDIQYLHTNKGTIDKIFELRKIRKNPEADGVGKRSALAKIRKLNRAVPGIRYDFNSDNLYIHDNKLIKTTKPADKVNFEDVGIDDKAKKSFEDLPLQERATQETMSDFVEPEDLPPGSGAKVIEKGKEDINKDNGKEKSKEAQLVRQAAIDKNTNDLKAKTGFQRLPVDKEKLNKIIDDRTAELESEIERKGITSDKGNTSFNFGANNESKQTLPTKTEKPTVEKNIKKNTEGVSKNNKVIPSKISEKLDAGKITKQPYEMTDKEYSDVYVGKDYPIGGTQAYKDMISGIEKKYDKKYKDLEPYEITKNEYTGVERAPKSPYGKEYDVETAIDDHEAFVEQALKEGKAVPEEVLKGYPELKDQFPQAGKMVSQMPRPTRDELTYAEKVYKGKYYGLQPKNALQRLLSAISIYGRDTDNPQSLSKAKELKKISQSYKGELGIGDKTTVQPEDKPLEPTPKDKTVGQTGAGGTPDVSKIDTKLEGDKNHIVDANKMAKNTKSRLDEKKTFPGGLTTHEQKTLDRINKLIEQEEGKPQIERTKAGDQYTLGATVKPQHPTTAKYSHGEGKGIEGTPLANQKGEDKDQTNMFVKELNNNYLANNGKEGKNNVPDTGRNLNDARTGKRENAKISSQKATPEEKDLSDKYNNILLFAKNSNKDLVRTLGKTYDTKENSYDLQKLQKVFESKGYLTSADIVDARINEPKRLFPKVNNPIFTKAINKSTGLEETRMFINDVEKIPLSIRNKLAKQTIKDAGGGTELYQKLHPLTETDNFKKWFGKSSTVNKDGSPKIMYHGTNRTFDTFRDNRIIYLTDNPEYADMYSIGSSAKGAHYVGQSELKLHEKTKAGGNIMPVYARTENRFDTTNPKHKKVFENEYFMKYGNGTPLDSKLGLPDWTDAEDLQEFFEEKGYRYDSILLAESHGQTTTAVFSPNQIKSIHNNGEYSKSNNDILHQNQQPLSTIPKVELQKEMDLVNKYLGKDFNVELDKDLTDGVSPVAGSTDINTNTIKINPQLVNPTTVMHEITHQATKLLLNQNPRRGKALLKLNGWDMKGDLFDISNETAVKAWENIADKQKQFISDEQKFMEDVPRAKWYKKIFDKLKQLWEGARNYFKGKGFVSEAKFYDDLMKGKFKNKIDIIGTPELQGQTLYQSSNMDLFKRLNKKTAEIEKKIEKPSKKVVKFESALLKDKISALKQGHRLGQLDLKESLRTVKKEMIQYLYDKLPSTKYDIAEVKKIARSIRDANTKTLDREFAKIDNLVENRNVKDYKLKTIELVRKSIGTKQKGENHPEVNAVLKKILREIVSKTPTSFDEETIALHQKFNLNGKTSKEIASIYNELKNIIDTGKIWYKEALDKKKKFRAEKRDQFIKDLGIKTLAETPEDLARLKKERFFFDEKMHTLSSKLDRMTVNKKGAREGATNVWADDIILRAGNKRFEIVEHDTKEFDKIFEKELGKNYLAKMIESKIEDNTGLELNNKELKMSKAQLTGRWLEWSDAHNRKGLEKAGYTQNLIDKIGNYIGSPFKNIAVWFRDEYLAKNWDATNEVNQKVFFNRLGRTDNYVPAKKIGYDEELDSFLKNIDTAGLTPGIVKPRVDNSNPLAIEGIFAKMHRYLSENSQFRAVGETGRDLIAVFNHPKTKMALEQAGYGKIINPLLKDLKDALNGGISQEARVRTLDKMRGRLTRAFVSLPVQIPKQIMSYAAYAFRIPPHILVKNTYDFGKHPIENGMFLWKNSPYLRERISRGYSKETAESLKGGNSSLTKNPIILTQFPEALRHNLAKYDYKNAPLIFSKMGDVIPIFPGMWSVYKYKYDGYIKEYSHEVAKDKALRNAEGVTKTTQQSGRPEDRSGFSRMGSFANLATWFKQSQTQYYQYFSNSFNDAVFKHSNIQEAVKIMTIAWVVLPQLFQWASDGFNWDKERQKRALYLGVLNAIPMVSDILSGFRVGNPIATTLAEVVRKAKKMDKDGYKAEDVLKLIQIAGQFSGVPTNQYSKYIKNVTTKTDSRYWLGYSDYALTEHNTNEGLQKIIDKGEEVSKLRKKILETHDRTDILKWRMARKKLRIMRKLSTDYQKLKNEKSAKRAKDNLILRGGR